MYGEDTRLRMLANILHCVFERLELIDETRALHACSLTCKLWLPIARKYLFREMTIASPPHPQPTPAWVDWYGFWRPGFADLSVVTRLVVMNHSDFPLTLNRLIPILQSLPVLNSLKILGESIRGFSPDPQPSLHLPTLTRLEISGLMTEEEPQDILDLIRSFHTAKSINIVEDEINFAATLTSFTPSWEQFSLPVGLASSSFRECNMAYLNVLTGIGVVPFLRRLYLAWWDLEDILDTGSGFLSNAGFLQTLEFDFNTHWDYTPSTAPSYDDMVESCTQVQRVLVPALSALRSLQTFSITPIDVSPHNVQWMLCFALLKALPPHLLHLELHLHEESAYFDLVSFRDCLGRLRELRTVKVFFDDAGINAPSAMMTFERFSARFHEILHAVAFRGVALEVLWEFRP